MEKVLINFNERGYETALQNFAKYKTGVQAVKDVASDLGVKVTDKELLGNNPFTVVADKLVKSMELNLPNISPTKYLQMTDIDTEPLSKASNVYNQFKSFSSKPNKEDFNVYLTDETAIERFNLLSGICDQLNSWKEAGIIKSMIETQRAFGAQVIADQRTLTFIPKI
jgi:hypothetical protein